MKINVGLAKQSPFEVARGQGLGQRREWAKRTIVACNSLRIQSTLREKRPNRGCIFRISLISAAASCEIRRVRRVDPSDRGARHLGPPPAKRVPLPPAMMIALTLISLSDSRSQHRRDISDCTLDLFKGWLAHAAMDRK